MNTLVLQQVVSGEGFSTLVELENSELTAIRGFVNDNWRARLEDVANKNGVHIEIRRMEADRYHDIEGMFIHKELWPKSQRILNHSFIDWFNNSHFKKRLTQELGTFNVSDEESLGYPNFYWRICRPFAEDDIGPVHRDSWFWEANPSFPKPDYRFSRIKIWIPLYVEPGLNGLMVEPFSHLRTDIDWMPEYRDGIMKPKILTSAEHMKLVLVYTQNGQAIIFNDDLLHGGSINMGKRTRISLEFTALVRDYNEI